jgi:hypothetical protein
MFGPSVQYTRKNGNEYYILQLSFFAISSQNIKIYY